jgi:enoyl-CoA hydratase/carnithine racemase
LLGDFRVAAPEARFAANFVKLGFHPGFGLTDTLPRLIGAQAAALMLVAGRRINADTARAWGLIDQIALLDRLYDDALALATEIAANAPLAVQATRATLRQGLAGRVRAQADLEWVIQQELMHTADFAEGIRAVSERRAGIFQGR